MSGDVKDARGDSRFVDGFDGFGEGLGGGREEGRSEYRSEQEKYKRCNEGSDSAPIKLYFRG
jgi:hypothetical protein